MRPEEMQFHFQRTSKKAATKFFVIRNCPWPNQGFENNPFRVVVKKTFRYLNVFFTSAYTIGHFANYDKQSVDLIFIKYPKYQFRKFKPILNQSQSPTISYCISISNKLLIPPNFSIGTQYTFLIGLKIVHYRQHPGNVPSDFG